LRAKPKISFAAAAAQIGEAMTAPDSEAQLARHETGGPPTTTRARRSAPSRLRRRFGSGLRLIGALALVGAFYALFAPGISPAAAQDGDLSPAAQEGMRLFNTSCVTCHGNNAQGVPDRGPSLIGVGAAAVEFQVSTGRMPLARQDAQAERKTPAFNAAQTAQLAQFIQELGGGPQMPAGTTLRATGPDAIAEGGELFRVNCSSCHAFGAGGGALSSGKSAPGMERSTDRQIYAAMLTGPENMPVFGDNQLTPEQKQAIIAYLQNMKEDQDPGGWAMGRLGPVPEGLAIFLFGMVILVVATVWIAGKS
jgi:ubiquinol-cytochrome c reductase cytochrome c subunit